MPALPLLAINAMVMMAAALGFWLSGDLAPQAIAHIAFALGILPLILAAIAYFVPVLTRSASAPPQLLAVPLAAWLGAACMVAAFAGTFDPATASHAAFTLAAAAAIALLLWIAQRARIAVGLPHPCLYWYQAALACLILALLAVPAMALWPAQRMPLRLFHLHLNLLGFVGLTALGTLQVLLPTAAGRPDPAAAQRLSRDLKFAFAGALLIACGAAFGKPLALLGTALFAIAPLRMGSAWVCQFADRIFCLHGAAPSLASALLGLLGLLVAGLAHAFGIVPGRPAIGGFVAAFLLPLVSGAAMQLLPVWLRPGPQGAWHGKLRDALGRLGGVRALLMVGGGLAIAGDWPQGFWIALAGVALFAMAALTAGKNLRH
jgi:hypothetical protein